MSNIIKEQDDVRYVIKMNGNVISEQFANRAIAENAVMSMPADLRPSVTIVPVSPTGSEMLFG